MAAIRRLISDDASGYRAIRLEGLQQHPDAFGVSFDAEAAAPITHFADRLRDSVVFGGFDGSSLLGVAGYYREAGETVRHKGVLFGMYVRAATRRHGLAKRLVAAVCARPLGTDTTARRHG